ncbi:bifunctional (p)ppGpp synthetase/guanosine-3',5'-bis(diphosphate) 3'-pyrophosphohydrolase, partial [Candidatus Woesearchaeota archaeon]|nr:bifunctional (p)ppGpp synthetase/guanosine-3',5'-bis(diphosphate) 3'-pyrophosphohydrolase [Candidatus Woesearchaeota archaeon]
DGHLIIHHNNCVNIKALPQAKLMRLHWNEEQKQPNSLTIEITDRVGILADILNTLTAAQVNIESVNSKSTRNKLYVNFEVSGKYNSDELIRKIKAIRNVVNVKIA